MNNSCMITTTFCRTCKKLRSCLTASSESDYRYLCKECTKEENIIGKCVSCGREGTSKELLKHGGYCHLCEDNNILECGLCGAETYSNNTSNGVCNKCNSGENEECIKCGSYFSKDKLTSDNLCPKCSIKIHKHLKESEVNEVVECVECGREVLVNDTNNGLCIFCYAGELESRIKKLKNKKTYA